MNEVTKAHNVGVPIRTVSCFAVKGDVVLPRGAVGELGTCICLFCVGKLYLRVS